MKKFRKWLIDRFLPRWAYESLLDELQPPTKSRRNCGRLWSGSSAIFPGWNMHCGT